jgi:hypothetical protein
MFPNFAAYDTQTFHQKLAHFNVSRLAPAMPRADWRADMDSEYAHRQAEGQFLEALRVEVAPILPDPPFETERFISWFEALVETGPGQQHALFDWLAEHATQQQMHLFLTQEAAGEAGFEDLLAYTLVKLPEQAKLECARNFWDEMGHGRPAAMHGPMLARMVSDLNLQPTIDATVWESLALSNTMVGLATTRRYAYQSIGALGVIELTAPGRARKVALGMQRLGLDVRTRAYFELHAVLDVAHARRWIAEVIRPLIEATPACAPFIAEGALMRLFCGERCYARYQLEFQTTQFALGQAHDRLQRMV